MVLTDEQVRQKIGAAKYWYHKIPIRPGIITPGINDAEATLTLLGPPADCSGLRVLDLGARDGFFSFAFERRGAEVLAVDYVPADQTGFAIAAELLGSKVPYLHENVYNLTPEKVGTFDVVLCLGLLYHLPDPMRALHLLRALCRDRFYLETQAIDNAFLLPDGRQVPLAKVAPLLANVPIMQFFPGSNLYGDPTNYWGPNLKCLQMMLKECKFAVEGHHLHGGRAILKARAVEDESLEYHNGIAYGLNLRA